MSPRGELIGTGRIADVYSYGPGRALRLPRTAQESHVKGEFEAMQALWAAGAPVPQPFEMVHESGKVGLVMERVEGPDLLTFLGRRPYLLHRVGTITGRLQAQINSIPAPALVPSWRDVAAERLEVSADLVSDGQLFLAARALLERLQDGDAVCHGDFHPANILLSGSTPKVIDWTDVKRGPREADIARTLVILRTARLPVGSPIGLRLAAAGARGMVTSAYLAAYRRVAPFDPEQVELWYPVQLLVRISEVDPLERPRLLREAAKGMAG